MNKRVTVVSTDNRDVRCTVLTLSNGTTVEVDPIELYGNAVENNPEDEEVAEEEERYKEYQANQDHPERDEGERFQDKYDKYRREY